MPVRQVTQILTSLAVVLVLVSGQRFGFAAELSVDDFDFNGILGSDGATREQLGTNHFTIHLARAPGHHVVNQHCYEYNAMWRIAGMIDWLLSDEEAKARQRNVWHFVAQMNVDGPHNGWGRVNRQGIDMNRAY